MLTTGQTVMILLIIGIAAFFENRLACLGMLLERGVDLPVEIVQECDVAPGRLVFAASARVRAYRGLNGQGVAAQSVGLDELADDAPGSVAVVDEVGFHRVQA